MMIQQPSGLSNEIIVANAVKENQSENKRPTFKQGKPRKSAQRSRDRFSFFFFFFVVRVCPCVYVKMDRSELTFVGWFKQDVANVRDKISSIEEPNPKAKSTSKAKGFQRGGVRTQSKEVTNNSQWTTFHNKPPETNEAYARIRIWKDSNDRKFYDCICNCRKPVQDLMKIKRHVLSHDQASFQCDICGRMFHKNHLQSRAMMEENADITNNKRKMYYSMTKGQIFLTFDRVKG
ncbi:hypothetical protein RFI_05070 [Reticulomyxa filosa]|uniref:C2H2-type domain-containing protein n=1 Tax=Reticulomyxa filosa TaxID=46433 RepID=X6P1V3_RETFI|nr:hypothetical protein RFI_05070 [Reticulomyxa filosa]|eukprot:ETO32044.1 hypothetical protein RFI_05070 [Reticulomyxa filosa]